MKELVEVIAKALVSNPEGVIVKESENDEGETVLELTVDPADMGKVIGKQGRIAKAIRSVPPPRNMTSPSPVGAPQWAK